MGIHLVEARRPDRDKFFGRTDGWYVLEEDMAEGTIVESRKYKPGEYFNGLRGWLVFEEDGYRTMFSTRQRTTRGENDKSLTGHFWVTCSDTKTKIHVDLCSAEDNSSSLSLQARSKYMNEQHASDGQFSIATLRRSTSFRESEMAKRTFETRVLNVKFRHVIFFAYEWKPFSEDQNTLQLTVSYRNEEPEQIFAKGKSELLSPEREFETTSAELDVSLVRVNDTISRVIALNPMGMGYREGVRVGDLLLSTHSNGLRRWRRMEMRRVVFDADLEFDFEPEDDEDYDSNYLQSKHLVTFTLRLCPSQDSVVNDAALEPLEFLFGSEPIIDSNGVGNCQLDFILEHAQGQVVGPIKCPSMNYLKVVDPIIHLRSRSVHPEDVCLFRVSAKASITLSLVATTNMGVHSDLSLISFQGIELKNEVYANQSIFLEASMKSFQVDDQRNDAAFPVAIYPTPLNFQNKDEGNDLDEAPSFRAALFIKSSDPLLTTINSLEIFLTETTLKLHESFLLSLAEFAFSLRPPGNGDVPTNSTEETKNDKSLVESKRLYLELADFKPMRFNITFTSATSESDKKVQLLIRKIPFVSALIAAVASVSDAPLRLRAVRLEKVSKTSDAIIQSVTRHYSNEVMRGLLAIAGSTDILGSPVNFLGSVSKGTMAFFYEPALALTMGYGQIGRGLQRGGSEFLGNAAGGLFESFYRMARAVAKAIAQSSSDQSFVDELDRRLKMGSFDEPINFHEGMANGLLLIVRSIIDAIVGLNPQSRKYPRRKKTKVSSYISNAILALLLKPSAGFFAALSQFSIGVRNSLTGGMLTTCFPSRLPRPREPKLQPYSAHRSAGYLLARHRFGSDVKFIFNQICQLEIQISENTKHALVTSLIVTDEWLVACRETLLDVWAIPLSVIEDVAMISEKKLIFYTYGQPHIVACRRTLDAHALQQSFGFASKVRLGQVSRYETFVESLPERARLIRSPSSTVSLQRLNDDGSGGSEIDIAGCRVSSAEIQSCGYWDDGVFRYQIRLISTNWNVEWIVERRYSEFLRFRDHACRFLAVSRRSMPLPGRRPWKLSVSEIQERWRGLQSMLNLALKIDLLAESEVLREFLTRGADYITFRT